MGVSTERVLVKRFILALLLLAVSAGCAQNSSKPPAESGGTHSANPAPASASASAAPEPCPNIVTGYKLSADSQGGGQLQIGESYAYPELENQAFVSIDPQQLRDPQTAGDQPVWKMAITLQEGVTAVGVVVVSPSGTAYRAGTASNPITGYTVESKAREYTFFAYKPGVDYKLPDSWRKLFPGCTA